MYQRSADWFLGCPFNITSYGLLLVIVCKITNLVPGELIMSFGDVHLYEDHIEQAKEQCSRIPKKFPNIKINKELKSIDDIKDLEFKDIILENYVHEPAIKAKMIA